MCVIVRPDRLSSPLRWNRRRHHHHRDGGRDGAGWGGSRDDVFFVGCLPVALHQAEATATCRRVTTGREVTVLIGVCCVAIDLAQVAPAPLSLLATSDAAAARRGGGGGGGREDGMRTPLPQVS